jgi:DNA polymerase
MMNEKEILEWYVSAGVDVICGDEPFVFSEKIKPAVVQKTDTRPAITDLAQMSQAACKNARDICSKAQSLEELKKAVEMFDGCALKLTANKTVFGDGNVHAKIMFVGEAPGADEDRLGKPFVGRSGHLLDKMLNAVGIKRSDCYITNVLMWRPPGNRTPTSAEAAVCLPFLKRKIELIQPEIIVTLGAPAANALLDNEDTISKIRGKWLEYSPLPGVSIPLLPTFHPAYLLRNPVQKAKVWYDLLKLVKKISND